MVKGMVETIYKLNYFIFFVDEKTQGKSEEHRENTGNFVVMGAWQPCN